MKSSIRTLCPGFNMHRQVKEYTESFYLKAHRRFTVLTADNASRARMLASWIDRIRSQWSSIAITSVAGPGDDLAVGSQVFARASVQLARLTPDDVRVEMLLGQLDKQREITDPAAYTMLPTGRRGDEWVFESQASCCRSSGMHGFTVRVVPSHPDLCDGCIPGAILWADESSVARASA
jgi:starch phosphorylase